MQPRAHLLDLRASQSGHGRLGFGRIVLLEVLQVHRRDSARRREPSPGLLLVHDRRGGGKRTCKGIEAVLPLRSHDPQRARHENDDFCFGASELQTSKFGSCLGWKRLEVRQCCPCRFLHTANTRFLVFWVTDNAAKNSSVREENQIHIKNSTFGRPRKWDDDEPA